MDSEIYPLIPFRKRLHLEYRYHMQSGDSIQLLPYGLAYNGLGLEHEERLPDELFLDDDLPTDHPAFRILPLFSSCVEKRTRGSVDFSGYESKTGSETYSGQLDSFDPSEGYEVFLFDHLTI